MTQTDSPDMHNGNGTHAHTNNLKSTPEIDTDYKHPMEIEDVRARDPPPAVIGVYPTYQYISQQG